MRRSLLTFFLFCIILSSCKKDDPCIYTESAVVVPAAELANLQAWVTANRPMAIQHPGGFYYEIDTAGTGNVPSICSNVTVKYAGFLTNGFKFTSASEENVGSTFVLGQLIGGWQRGIPLIKAGGTIRLYLPPSLGYGSNAAGPIPPNSILLFTIQLTGVQ